MSKLVDLATQYIKQALDVLFIDNRTGTSIGVLFGVLIENLVRVFKPILKKILIIDLSAISIFPCIIFGVLLFNFHLLFRRRKLDPKIKEALHFVRELKRTKKMHDWEIRQMYRNLSLKVFENISLQDNVKEEQDKIQMFL